MVFPLKRILSLMPEGVLAALSDVEIEKEDQNTLELLADGWRVTFDKPSQAVTYSGRQVASFSSLDSIDVAHFVNGRRFEWWVLSLRVRGGKKLRVGRSTDGAQISVVAAHAARITGKAVRAVEGVGL